MSDRALTMWDAADQVADLRRRLMERQPFLAGHAMSLPDAAATDGLVAMQHLRDAELRLRYAARSESGERPAP